MAKRSVDPCQDGGRRTTEAPAPSERLDSVRSLDRALSILEVVAAAPRGITLSSIANQIDLPVSTTHRLLTTLEARAFVSMDKLRKTWRVGRMAACVGGNFAASRDLVSIARPIMTRAAARVGEVFNLGTVSNDAVVFVHRVDPRSRRTFAPAADALPVHCTSVGKAVLSFSGPGEIERVAGGPLAPRTRHTLTSRTALLEDLARSRRTGYAVDREENSLGLKCLAAPIFDEHQVPIAALSLAQPTSRAGGDATPLLGELVCGIAAEITRSYGGVPLR
jgi:IclR family acetate operon transcriptional repressor